MENMHMGTCKNVFTNRCSLLLYIPVILEAGLAIWKWHKMCDKERNLLITLSAPICKIQWSLS